MTKVPMLAEIRVDQIRRRTGSRPTKLRLGHRLEAWASCCPPEFPEKPCPSLQLD